LIIRLIGVNHKNLGSNIKQAIQGLFTAGTSEQKEKVGGKRGLTP